MSFHSDFFLIRKTLQTKCALHFLNKQKILNQKKTISGKEDSGVINRFFFGGGGVAYANYATLNSEVHTY